MKAVPSCTWTQVESLVGAARHKSKYEYRSGPLDAELLDSTEGLRENLGQPPRFAIIQAFHLGQKGRRA